MILKSQSLQATVLTKTIGAQAQFYFFRGWGQNKLAQFLIETEGAAESFRYNKTRASSSVFE